MVGRTVAAAAGDGEQRLRQRRLKAEMMAALGLGRDVAGAVAAASSAGSIVEFRFHAWSPVVATPRVLRPLELYVVAGGAFADMCVKLYSTHLRIFVDGGAVNPAHLNCLEHGGMLLMFFLFGALALASQLWPRLFLSIVGDGP